MGNTLQYVVDNKGERTSVIVPYEEWEKINVDYQKLQNKLKVFVSIQKGLSEIKVSKEQGTKLQTLSDFLDESLS
jgi:hypothetical protein